MKRHGLQFHSSEAESALHFFLSQVTLPDKRARYLDLISRPNSRRKFLGTYYHELEHHLDPARRVESLTVAQLQLPGYQFKPGNDALGEPLEALAVAVASMDESFLVVSSDGRVGVHGPESIDGRTFYVVH